MKAERAVQTFNSGDRQIEVRIQSEPKTGRTLWRAYLVSKQGDWPKTSMRLCERDNRKDCLEFIERYVTK
jgi:hypothetical protein